MPNPRNPESVHAGACHCGHAGFTVRGPAVMRLICHCTICQAFNQAAFADIAFFRGRDVDVADRQAIAYKAWRRPPSAQRGSCRNCGDAVIEHMTLPGLALTMIPVQRLQNADVLPAPALHIFYDRRQTDAADNLPKYSGYWSSELALARHLIPALLRR